MNKFASALVVEVNHINGNKRDNRSENLEWCTHSENIRHADRTGLRNVRGEMCNLSRLTAEQVLEIRAAFASGVRPTEAGLKFGLSKSSSWRIATNRSWRHLP